MLIEKKIYKTWSFVLSYGHRPEAAFSTHRWPVNDCLPKVWPHINQVLFLFENSPKFCNRLDLGWGNYLARRRKKWNQVWPGANTRRWHVHDGQTRCNSTGDGLHQGLHECAGCHGTVTVAAGTLLCKYFFMVNYQVMLQEQLDQMALILW